jgi:4-amino-4-deoxy-L-arabinose transferase-like glycosyltransferase
MVSQCQICYRIPAFHGVWRSSISARQPVSQRSREAELLTCCWLRVIEAGNITINTTNHRVSLRIMARLRWWVIIILLVYLGLRLANLLALPLFIDETLHAQRAELVWQGSPLGFGGNGKYLGAWWVALFFPFPPDPWLTRAAILLPTVLSAAAALALARRLFGQMAALYTGVILCLAPMLFFFDRLSLADTTLHPVVMLFTLSLFHLFDTPTWRWRRAVISGGLLALAVLAKATALVWVPLPVVAMLLLPQGWRGRDRLLAVAGVWASALILWLPLLLLLRWRGIDYLGVPLGQHSANANNLLIIERVLGNVGFVLDGLVIYLGVIPLLVGAVLTLAAVLAQPRRGTVLALGALGPALGLALAGSATVSLRYWVAVLPSFLILVGSGLTVVTARLGKAHAAAGAGALAVWALTLALPFFHTAYTDPTALNLPRKDRLEYIQADSAGTLLPELATFLEDIQAEHNDRLFVSGAISQCYGLSLYLADAVELDCPRIFSADMRAGGLDAHLVALAAEHDPYYVIFEQPGLVSVDRVTSLALEPVATFPRPDGVVTITVYKVE